MTKYSISDIAGAYGQLCSHLTTDGKISDTDIDGLARVGDEVEKMLAHQLVREGMSLIDATNAVQEASTSTAKASDLSRKLLEEAQKNRFLPIDDAQEAQSTDRRFSGDGDDGGEAVADDADAAQLVAAPAGEDPAGGAPETAGAAPAKGAAVARQNVERAQRLRNRIGYRVSMRKVSDIFTAIPAGNPLFDFEIPYITWDIPHPSVPTIDAAYNMEEDALATVLYAIANRKSTAIVGPHGAGKTKLVEQVGARIGMPVTVIPVDGQITRGELFGQEKIRSTATGPESYFQYGILPSALEEPGIILFDEIDRADPGIQYACHSVYEQTSLVLMEHDGRRIPMHDFNRVFATANTKGRGSDDGMYGGDNEMSEATRDRFSLWIEIDYQDIDADIMVLRAKVAGLDEASAKTIAKFAQMIRKSFKEAALSQTCSMRQQLETAEMAVHNIATSKAKNKKEKVACLRRALDRVILGRANEQDKNSMNEFLQTIDPDLALPATV